MLSWKIKICGIKSAFDACAAAEFGAGAIGLNFYTRSMRSVTKEEAKAVVAVLPRDIARVGVFVNESADIINRIASELDLDAIQLHGDEQPEIAASIDKPIIRAIRIFEGRYETATDEINAWGNAGADAILVDAGSKAAYGGTGQTLDWGPQLAFTMNRPTILAGGLNCDNVAQAIELVRPNAVDVASGVEKFPGAKDHAKMRRFIEAANMAFS